MIYFSDDDEDGLIDSTIQNDTENIEMIDLTREDDNIEVIDLTGEEDNIEVINLTGEDDQPSPVLIPAPVTFSWVITIHTPPVPRANSIIIQDIRT